MRGLVKIILRGIAVLTIMGIATLALLVAGVRYGYLGKLPSAEDFKQTNIPQPILILDINGRLIDKINDTGQKYTPYESLPPSLIDLLVSTEDKRFYQHNGIDFYSLARVVFKTLILQNRSSGGGSTITQQLAKNMYPRKDYKYFYYPVNKIREMIIATQIEKTLNKNEILELYLNTVPFGSNTHGIADAATTFFNKKPEDLYLHESATLVGILKATTYYSPVLNPDRSLARRNLVLSLAKDNGYFDYALDSLKDIPLKTAIPEKSFYLRDYLTSEVERQARKNLSSLDKMAYWNNGGLKIRTTIDLDLQEVAEGNFLTRIKELQKKFDAQVSSGLWSRNAKLINRLIGENNTAREMKVFTHDGLITKSLTREDSLKHYLKFLHGGLLSAEPGSGAIKAWVGGINHLYFPYDHVRISSKRQVGSIIKPFLYGTAIEQGISPCDKYDASQQTYTVDGKEWTPGNSGGVNEGEFDLQEAMSKSLNTVAVKLVEDVGIMKFISTLKKAGIESEIPRLPSIALGTPEISLYEMIQAYTAFANHGQKSTLFLIESIETPKGEKLYQRDPEQLTRVFSERTATIMMKMLKRVVEEGTATSLSMNYGIKGEVGAKTGTTQNASDGWFISVTPMLITGAWVGGEYPGIHFERAADGQGARTALPIVGSFLKDVYAADYQQINRASFGYNYSLYEDETNCETFMDDLNFISRLFDRLKQKRKNDTLSRKTQRRIKKENRRSDDSKNNKKGILNRLKSIFKKESQN